MEKQQQPEWFNRVHLVGVAGVGMSALAELLIGLGGEVSGSDRFLDDGRRLGVLDVLERQGVRLFPQDGSGVEPGVTAVGVSTAIEAGNADLEAAAGLGIPVRHRSEFLAGLAAHRRCVGIAGTSGKTTVTGMVGWVLDHAGLNPTVVNGGGVLNWKNETRTGSVRVGESDLLVLELDESDRSLLRFRPETALINNMSRDHFGEAETHELFRDFSVRVTGPVLAGVGVGELLRALGGCAEVDFIDCVFPEFLPGEDGTGAFRYEGVEISVSQPGRHNLANAFMTTRLCRSLGVPLETVRDAFARFGGIHRRLEEVGQVSGIRVVDDYAHNPEKIRAAWEAARLRSKRILGFWRPHGFRPLEMMMDDLVACFDSVMVEGDELYLLPVFYAGGTARQSVNSKDLGNLLTEKGLRARVVEDYSELKHCILGCARAEDTILGMGARDPEISTFCKAVIDDLSKLHYK